VISPILANVYLHYVLDQWFHEVVQPRLRGRAFLIRFADDFVIGFTDESDARRVMQVVPQRFAKYELTVHRRKRDLSPSVNRGPRRSLRPRTVRGSLIFLASPISGVVPAAGTG